MGIIGNKLALFQAKWFKFESVVLYRYWQDSWERLDDFSTCMDRIE